MAAVSKSDRPPAPGANSGAEPAINSGPPMIFVLDDDPGMREALSSLLASVGLRVAAFGSAAEFLNAKALGPPACLILDLKLPDINGLDVQRKLAENDGPPIVFISGNADIPSSVQAMKAGAIEFLPKPFSDQELLGAIDSAIAQNQKEGRTKAELAALKT